MKAYKALHSLTPASHQAPYAILTNIIATGPLRLLSLVLFLDFVLAIFCLQCFFYTFIQLAFLPPSKLCYLCRKFFPDLSPARGLPSYSSRHSVFVIAFITISNDLVSLFNMFGAQASCLCSLLLYSQCLVCSKCSISISENA